MIFVKVSIQQIQGKETKRLSLSREPDQLTYDELCILIQRLFPKIVKASDVLTIKYEDEDGDLVYIDRDEDIKHAIILHSKVSGTAATLKIIVFLDSYQQNLIKENNRISDEIEKKLLDMGKRQEETIQKVDQVHSSLEKTLGDFKMGLDEMKNMLKAHLQSAKPASDAASDPAPVNGNGKSSQTNFPLSNNFYHTSASSPGSPFQNMSVNSNSNNPVQQPQYPPPNIYNNQHHQQFQQPLPPRSFPSSNYDPNQALPPPVNFRSM